VEVLVLYAKKVEEVKEAIELPQEMLMEFNTLEQKSRDTESFVYISSRRLSTHKQPNQIREALMKGYVEMSQINLSISSECLHAEYEAEHMVERLVSGG
jgi:CopG family transcriptional regulator/antitoxin EndoAI